MNGYAASTASVTLANGYKTSLPAHAPRGIFLGAAKVGAKGARGAARSANERNGAKAEIFEDALARVSRQLSVAARRSARDLKDERLARARGDAAPAKPAKKSAAKVKGVARVRVADTRNSPARKKRDASTLAKGARRQAKRDSRRG